MEQQLVAKDEENFSFSLEEAEKIILSTPYTKNKLFIELVCIAGVPLEEAIRIKTKDIFIDERLLCIKDEKGVKKYVVLSERFIERYVFYLTERYYKGTRSDYIFDRASFHIILEEGKGLLKSIAHEMMLKKG